MLAFNTQDRGKHNQCQFGGKQAGKAVPQLTIRRSRKYYSGSRLHS
jgi:hypothetical protein